MAIELRLLRYFAVVAEERHVGNAAARLFISQPALSQQIQSLEEQVGLPLFVRRPKGVELTEREAEILDLMAEGLTTEQIAERLFVAKVTVRTHVSALLRKLRVPDREAAIRLSRGGHQQM